MKYKVAFCFLAFLASTYASIAGVKVLQGPGSRTTVIGPDGSALDAVAPGGTVAVDSSGLTPAGPALLAVAGAPIAVNGPAGSIITSHTLAGLGVAPAVAASAIGIGAAPAIAVSSVGLGAGAALALGGVDVDDNGHEGAYIPDIHEAY